MTVQRTLTGKIVRPSEEACEDTIIHAAMSFGYHVHAERKAWSSKGVRTPIKGNPGWPDLAIVGWGRAFFVELKRRPNTVEPDQHVWLNRFDGAGLDARVLWVPEEMDDFIAMLQLARTQFLTSNPKKGT